MTGQQELPADPTATVREAELLRLRMLAIADELDRLAEEVRQAAVAEQARRDEEGTGDERPADPTT